MGNWFLRVFCVKKILGVVKFVFIWFDFIFRGFFNFFSSFYWKLYFILVYGLTRVYFELGV